MIRVDGVDVCIGEKPILDRVSLQVETGETMALVGPSGSGKSTLLRVIAGLRRPDRGLVVVNDADVTTTPTYRRGVGLVFQDAVLFPHRDVAGNVSFGLTGMPKDERRARVDEMLALVGLPGFQRRSVGSLSGGEAQRVALARALAPAPRVLLLDEPLGALDGPLRDRLQDDLLDLFARLRLTVVHVTHDVAEAFALGHRVALMREGRIVQVDEPDDLWRKPASVWVARFLGLTNTVVRDGRAAVVRPEAVSLRAGDTATVVAVERRGSVVHLTVLSDDGTEIEAATTALVHPARGDRVSVEIDPDGVIAIEGDAGDVS